MGVSTIITGLGKYDFIAANGRPIDQTRGHCLLYPVENVKQEGLFP
jgi:hypothetical protein